MSEQKKSIDSLKSDQTNTEEVKGGFNPRNLKASQGRTRDTSVPDKDKPEEARPLGGVDRVHEGRNFRKK